MFQHVDETVTGSSIDHLNERISQVTQKFAGLVSISSALCSTTGYISPLHSPGIPTQEQKESPLSFPSANLSCMSTQMDHSGSDQSRKRCASELEEHRNVKAPKREPTDDIPLKIPFVGTTNNTTSSSTFTSSPLLLPATAQPSARAATPPSFSSQGPFSAGQALQGPSSYTSYSSNGSQVIDFNPGLPTQHGPMNPFTAQHPPWPEATIQTRHHHSLSTGAISGTHLPTVSPVVANIAEIYTASPISLQALPAPSVSMTISSPIGRISRSGSINGTFPSSFSFGHTETRTEQVVLWTNKLRTTANALASQNATHPWCSGVDNSSSSITPPSDKLSLGTAPDTTQNLPHVEDDEDEPVQDSDDDESPHSKEVHRVSSSSLASEFPMI